MEEDFRKIEQKLANYMKENNVNGKFIVFKKSVHTVEDACREVGANPDDFVKTICMIDENGNVISALVLGSYRASTSRVSKVLEINKPHVATPEEALEKTGFLVGGTPPFGYNATFIIDPKVIEKDSVYAGGGTPYALVKISPKEILRINNGKIARVRK